MKYAFIERNRKNWPVTIQCSVLDVSVNGYRKYLKRQRASNAPSVLGRRVPDMALLATSGRSMAKCGAPTAGHGCGAN